MIRTPGPGRFEFRLADGAVNPYLLQAALLAAGLDGVENRRDPGRHLEVNMYTSAGLDVPRLPLNMLDALHAFEASPAMRAALGEEFSNAYIKLKHQEWTVFASQLTQWERDTTLDC